MSQSQDILSRAIDLVVQHENKRNDLTLSLLKPDEVLTVWFSKTLQNWKGIFATTRKDGMLYEVTHNGDLSVTYVDSYKKWENSSYPDTDS